MLLAACYGQLERVYDERAAWETHIKGSLGFSLTQRACVLFYKDAADFERIVQGLAKAGLP
jgi:adenylate cyclase